MVKMYNGPDEKNKPILFLVETGGDEEAYANASQLY
jgi:hypothetical protein